VLSQNIELTTGDFVKPFKNYCDHDKNNFVFYNRNSTRRNPPKPIEIASINLKYWAKNTGYYLCHLKSQRYSNKNMRSQRRESVANVAQCIINHTDLCTMQPIKYNCNESPSSLNAGLISAITNISYSRVLRALTDLECGGYIKVKHSFSFKTGGIIHRRRHLLKVSKRLFVHLGVCAQFLEKTISKLRSMRELEPTLEREMTNAQKLGMDVNRIAAEHEKRMKKNKQTGPQMFRSFLKTMSIRQ